MNIVIADERDDPPSTQPADQEGLAALARVVLQGELLPPTCEVTVTLVEPGEMARLNHRHLGNPGPTDVLSLPIEDLIPGEPPVVATDDPPLLIGDVVICPAVVAEHAAAHDVSLDDEMALMVTHGLLHLLGYDHQGDAEAARMESIERRYLTMVGRSRR
ncbi:MAG: rRNA maturation RNase YbeY [Acidimicrobiia bacterium]|nr:rRNA maturation RNase YbeY [Acidimicrobiia bacterium]